MKQSPEIGCQGLAGGMWGPGPLMEGPGATLVCETTACGAPVPTLVSPEVSMARTPGACVSLSADTGGLVARVSHCVTARLRLHSSECT